MFQRTPSALSIGKKDLDHSDVLPIERALAAFSTFVLSVLISWR
jgi:hypothetical protein